MKDNTEPFSWVQNIQVFFFRSKQNWGNQAFYPKHDSDDDVKEILSSFLTQFYENKVVPKMIITNTEIKDLKLLEKSLKNSTQS